MKKYTFGVCSDLHLDFYNGIMPDVFFEWSGDVLILSGDIAEEQNYPRYSKFFSRVSKMAERVYVIAGNHEFYHGEIDRSIGKIREALTPYENIKVLDAESDDYNGILIWGGTLWSEFDRDPMVQLQAQDYMNDYRLIRVADSGYRKLRPYDTYKIFAQHRDAVFDFVKKNEDRPVVVATHHAPSWKSVAKKYHSNKLNGAYVSDLDMGIIESPNIRAWVHGHVHAFFDYTIGETRVICNPGGYPGERPAGLPPFQPFTFEVTV